MTRKLLNVYEVKARFSYYAREVIKGKTFVLAIRNKPFAELRPLPATQKRKLVFGVLRKKFSVPTDFNAALPEFEREYYAA